MGNSYSLVFLFVLSLFIAYLTLISILQGINALLNGKHLIALFTIIQSMVGVIVFLLLRKAFQNQYP